ncbi:MAG: hypothetical protein ACTHVE_07960 [Senegalia sp. (in: firmicutes)]|uniref:hypothetical protein n=1 Tax=Senegalia sp. (in: firmicutes) TaxID=1924098 RepID=UPI003F9C8C16
MPVSGKKLAFLIFLLILINSIIKISRNISEFIAFSLYQKYYSNFGAKRDFTEVISQEINPFLSSILITDTTGIEVSATKTILNFINLSLKS